MVERVIFSLNLITKIRFCGILIEAQNTDEVSFLNLITLRGLNYDS